MVATSGANLISDAAVETLQSELLPLAAVATPNIPETEVLSGMTVTQVLGCGMQKGTTEYYRGVETEVNLLPKVQVEIVVAKVPVRAVIEAAKGVLYTGHMELRVVS